MLAKTQTPLIDPDADLISRLKAGDESALEALMERRLPTIHGLALRLLGDTMQAEDIAQIVMLKSWTEVKHWEPGRAKLLTWMCRVTTNLCVDALRKKRPLYSDNLPEVADSAHSQFDSLQAAHRANRVQSALRQLPPRQSAALTLCYFRALSQAEAAQVLDISISAYESLLTRGRQSLRRLLQDERDIL
jgi:RNA polymerase sigma-70 factor (ECF subfamily)